MARSMKSTWSRISFLGRAVDAYTLVGGALAVVTALLALLVPAVIWTDIALWLTFAWILGDPIQRGLRAWRRSNTDELLMGEGVLARIILVLAALAMVIHARDGSPWAITAGAMVCLLALAEQAMRRPIRQAAPRAANLPGWEVPLPSIRLANWFFWLNCLGAALVLFAASLSLSPVFAMIAVLPSVALAALLARQALLYLTRRNRLERSLPQIMKDLGPVFTLHWHAPAGTAYQVAMWLPYLAKLGVPYFVLVRSSGNFDEVAQLTDAPVLLRSNLEDLDEVVPASLKVVFYVNTAVRNSHMIRFAHLTHIQLNHGDSDKIASVSPTFRQYDRNFVAGQAAVERFNKHGVATVPGSLVVVGRPQLEAVQLATRRLSEAASPVVLYSPTWSGFYEDSDYSSLPAGPQIVEELLRRGCTVVFRPHPYSRRHKANADACDRIMELLAQDGLESGRQHLFGAAAATRMSIADCFNISDAMISDVSSVVSDYLMSRKPFAMCAVSAHGEAFLEEFPLGEAAYVIDVERGEVQGLAAALDGLLGADPKEATRNRLRSHYIGDAGPQECVDVFVAKAREFLV